MQNKMTPVERLADYIRSRYETNQVFNNLVDNLKQIERDERKKLIEIVYNIGYTDAQCNHVNDADNLAYEIGYMQSQIDDTPEKNCEYSGLPSVKSYEDPKK